MPAAILTVRGLAVLGVLVWVAVVVQRIADGWPADSWWVLLVAVVLAAAHASLGGLVPRRRGPALAIAVGILIADLVLAMAVNPRAWILAGAAVILLGATMLASPRP